VETDESSIICHCIDRGDDLDRVDPDLWPGRPANAARSRRSKWWCPGRRWSAWRRWGGRRSRWRRWQRRRRSSSCGTGPAMAGWPDYVEPRSRRSERFVARRVQHFSDEPSVSAMGQGIGGSARQRSIGAPYAMPSVRCRTSVRYSLRCRYRRDAGVEEGLYF
jgi:hypothetical protein